MEFAPGQDEPKLSTRRRASKHRCSSDVDKRPKSRVLSVKVSWIVVIPEHGDPNTKEDTDLRHGWPLARIAQTISEWSAVAKRE